MKVGFRFMGKEHRFREEPCVIGVSPSFKDGKVKIASIPFGKRYFDCQPCKPGCDPLIAKSSTPSELRDFYRQECCQNCK